MKTSFLRILFVAFIASMLSALPAVAENEQTTKVVTKGVADSVALQRASIYFADEVLLHDMDLSITSIDSTAVPELDYGMFNVSVEGEGFRFLPHGTHFGGDGATVKLGYDRTRIPSGYTEDDIRTYYYDTDKKNWVALQLVEVDKQQACVISRTTHFTDMINGVIVAPESPETSAFTPTMMNDIKAADPTSKINIITPPTANNRGSANLQYPFEMPPARNGMQPQVALSYNSDGGSGWAGEGWDISIPSITVDTRWGVPRYNTTYETETYLLNGQMLAMMNGNEMTVAHRTDSVLRQENRQFFMRQGGDFNLIIREGDNINNYYWVVTDRNGVKYTYGGDANARLSGTYTDVNGNQRQVIAEWKLTRIEEPHGDYIEYVYNNIDEDTISSNLRTKAIYLSQINAGNAGSLPHTKVTFKNLNAKKTIKINNARYGFLTSSSQLLDSVLVEFKNSGSYEKLRSYKLEYEDGPFYKRLLSRVSHRDNFGNEVSYQKFDYYNDIFDGSNIVPYQSISDTLNLSNDDLSAGFINPLNNIGDFSDNATALGGTKSNNTGMSIYAGIGQNDGNFISKGNTVGASFSYSYSKTSGVSTLIDLDGDGVPDKVFIKGGNLSYRPSMIADTIITINGIKDFLKTTSHTVGGGVKEHPMLWGQTVVVGADGSASKSQTDTYFADVNGDGLIDIVSKGKVYFNCTEYIDGVLNTHFSLSSADSPSPIINEGTIDSSETEVTAEEIDEAVDNSPMVDMVRVWIAPYDGNIQISGTVELLPPQEDDEDGADGIWYSIQHNNVEVVSDSIRFDDSSPHSASVAQRQVSKGDKIFFRLQSGRHRLSDGSSDRVNWNPVVKYIGKPNYTTPNGHLLYTFDSKESEVVSDTTLRQFTGSQELRIKGLLNKQQTSDNITLRVYTSSERRCVNGNYLDYNRHLVYERSFSWNEEYCDSLSSPIIYHSGENFIECEVYSTSNVAWENIKWHPVLVSESDSIALPVKYSIYAENIKEGEPFYAVFNDALTIDLQGYIYKPNQANGDMIMTVKSPNRLLAKQTLHFVNGSITDELPITIYTDMADSIWVELFTDNRELAESFIESSIMATPPQREPNHPFIDINEPGPYASIYSERYHNTTHVLVNLFTVANEDRFGPLYRGWGQFAYNTGAGNRYCNPIDTSLLKLYDQEISSTDTLDIKTIAFCLANPDIDSQNRWYGPNHDVYITGTTMGASRLGEKNVSLKNPLADIGSVDTYSGSKWVGTSARGIPLISISSSVDGLVSGGSQFGIIGASVSINGATGDSYNKTSFFDINGDGFPDIISGNKIQYTNTHGGFSGEIYSGMTCESGTNNSVQIGAGGNAIHSFSIGTRSGNDNSRAQQNNNSNEGAKNGSVCADFGIDYNLNDDYSNESFIDLNGDGLPDKVYDNGSARINLGYSFTDYVNWGVDTIQKTHSWRVEPNVGISLPFCTDKNASSFSAGVGISTMNSKGIFDVLDVNGDGLPDAIHKTDNGLYVALNLGNSYDLPILWQNTSEIKKSTSTSESVNAAFTIGFPIYPTNLKMAINTGAYYGHSMSRPRFELRDIDGDGFIDILESDSENKLSVKHSTIARTNKLRTVTNSLGGKFTLDYKHNTPTYGLPGGKWVMSSVEIDYGIHGDYEIPNTKNEFEYNNGRRDRHEREFLGFGKVITKNIDTQNNLALYRQTIEEYDTGSIYSAGNLLYSYITKPTGSKRTEIENQYYSYGLTNTAASGVNGGKYKFSASFPLWNDRGAAYCPLKYTRSVQYDDSDSTIMSESWNSYYTRQGDHGLLSDYRYSDKGTLGSSGTGSYDYHTSIDYNSKLSGTSYYFGQPSEVIVSNSGNLFHLTKATYSSAYPTQLTSVKRALHDDLSAHLDPVDFGGLNGDGLNGGVRPPVPDLPVSGPDTHGTAYAVKLEYATTDYEYDPHGNVTRVTLPGNGFGQRMSFSYTYDSAIGMYPVSVSDSHEFSSGNDSIDYRYGITHKQTDLHGFRTYVYSDHLGRTTGYNTPIELEKLTDRHMDLSTPSLHTIAFEYEPKAELDNTGQISRPAYAVTRHLNVSDVDHPEYFETITFVDGFGRPIQVKKESVVQVTSGSVSDTVRLYVVSGRQEYDPFGRVVGSYHPTTEALSSRLVLNRQHDAVDPTTTDYDILDRPIKVTLPDGAETRYTYSVDAGSHSIKTVMTDALDHDSETYTNGSGKTIKTVQYMGEGNTTPLNTTFEYDGISRLVKVTDAIGETTTSAYDLADRRTAVVHPASGKTTFTYGPAGNLLSLKTANMQGTDKSITYHYHYNQLDSVFYPDHPENNVVYHYGTKNDDDDLKGRVKLRIDGTGAVEYHYGKMGEVVSERRTVVVPNHEIATFNTQWEYDSHNRLMHITYPDEMTVDYSYDRGGALNRVSGSDGANNLDYVQDIRYDKFGDQIYLKYGNGSVTRYTYEADRRRLSSMSVGTGGNSFSDIISRNYSYDPVSNITGISCIGPGTRFTPVSHTYSYDPLNRLTNATGTSSGVGGSASYSLVMEYDSLYRITSKTQTLSQANVQFDGELNTGYALNYSYNGNTGKRFRMAKVDDVNYRVAAATVSDSDRINESHSYEYDNNGNIIYVNTSRSRSDRGLQPSPVGRTREEKFLWDEENHLLAISQDGYVSKYWYDADGERVVKEHGGNGNVYVNSQHSGGLTMTENYSVYPNGYYTYSSDGRYVKHIYIGGERVLSQVGGMYGEPRRRDVAGFESKIRVDYDTICSLQRRSINDAYNAFGLEYCGIDHDDYGAYPFRRPGYWSGALRSQGVGEEDEGGGHTRSAGDTELLYYFHKDHLGSSTLITDGTGSISQQVEYLPYGEVFLERQHNSDPSQPLYATPYKFNGKELDEETGLYYYGARYMNPRLSIWYATDPMQEKYPNISSYCFSMNSPICVFDADGNEVIWQLGRSMRRISGSLIKTKAYNTVYKRFIKNQDNVFIRKSSDNYFGYAPVEREHNGRIIFIGNNGLQINGDLTVDPTFLAKIILHEGLHQKYQMIHDEGMTSRYPTLSRHMYYDKIMKNYEGEHETMAECCIGLFVSGMKEFDKYYGTLHSDDWYNAMAWMGSLQDSYAWFELSASKREIYKSIIDNEYYYNAYLEALANYNSNKTSRNKQLLLKAQKEVDWKLFNKTRKK